MSGDMSLYVMYSRGGLVYIIPVITLILLQFRTVKATPKHPKLAL